MSSSLPAAAATPLATPLGTPLVPALCAAKTQRPRAAVHSRSPLLPCSLVLGEGPHFTGKRWGHGAENSRWALSP